MTKHSLLSPSSAHRWMNCPGSMGFPENREQGGSNKYADDGTATHTYAARILLTGEPGALACINGVEYGYDEERAARVQTYIDDVRRRAMGGYLFVEKWVDLSEWLGEGEGGTPDASIVVPDKRLGIICDLKDGAEKVYASYEVNGVRRPNEQLALYALGSVRTWNLFNPIDKVLLVINQPKLDHIDEFEMLIEDLFTFGERAVNATAATQDEELVRVPGKRQCRWCRAKTKCPELAKFVEEETRLDFEDVTSQPSDANNHNNDNLSKHYQAVPLIEQWCKAINAEVALRVSRGSEVIGPDGKPYKFVEGSEGPRRWINEEAAEAALAGLISPDKIYTHELISAPQAAKLLDKGATKPVWKDVFGPLIHRPRNKPVLAMGSDERPPFTGVAAPGDFTDALCE